MLERSTVPMTADLFLARAEKHARLTGTSLDAERFNHSSARSRMTTSIVSPRSLSGLRFGDDTAARDAAKREGATPQRVIQSGIYPPRNRGTKDGDNVDEGVRNAVGF